MAKKCQKDKSDMFTAKNLESIPHGFLTRRGGVSVGPLASLNFAITKDTASNVQENRTRALERLGITTASSALTICHQVHSCQVVMVERPWMFGVEPAPKADALVTTRPNIILGILSADCVPILLVDQHNGVVGAAHAGWRGLKQGIVHKVIQAMCQQGADLSYIKAAIGPCIHQESYEVGAEVRNAFVERTTHAKPYFKEQPTPQKYLCDLPGLTLYFLLQAGIGYIENIKQDTYTQAELFFSCRRATHRNEAVFGCQLSAIALSRI
ncbi:MAG: peptidoglycan editing factor PgeF [Pseudomonadota bacterium]